MGRMTAEGQTTTFPPSRSPVWNPPGYRHSPGTTASPPPTVPPLVRALREVREILGAA